MSPSLLPRSLQPTRPRQPEHHHNGRLQRTQPSMVLHNSRRPCRGPWQLHSGRHRLQPDGTPEHRPPHSSANQRQIIVPRPHHRQPLHRPGHHLVPSHPPQLGPSTNSHLTRIPLPPPPTHLNLAHIQITERPTGRLSLSQQRSLSSMPPFPSPAQPERTFCAVCSK